MNRKLLLIPLAAGISLAGLALAQSAPDGIDLAAIRANAAQHAEDAEALAAIPDLPDIVRAQPV